MSWAKCWRDHMGPKFPCWNCCLMVSRVAGVGWRSPLTDRVEYDEKWGQKRKKENWLSKQSKSSSSNAIVLKSSQWKGKRKGAWQRSITRDPVPDIIVSQIVLSEGDVGRHHTPHNAGHHQVLVEDDGRGHHQPSVREETRVVNVKYFTWTPNVKFK